MVNKKFLLTLIIALPNLASSQNNTASLLNAEKNFAAYSVANGVKDAFLKFSDSAAIIFENGKAVNAIATWNGRDKRPGVLNWAPRYAAISQSGDFGFTTGPWTFQSNAQDTVVARGIYTTVWRLAKDGQWKFIVDLGVSNSIWTLDTTDAWIKEVPDHRTNKPSTKSLVQTERKFIKRTSKAHNKGHSRRNWYQWTIALNSPCVLNRNGISRVMEIDHIAGIVDKMPSRIKYKLVGSAMASSGDLGYAYGVTIINDKTDNYLRIWRRENGRWRLAAEVVRY